MSPRLAFHSQHARDQPKSKSPPDGRGERRRKRRSPEKAVRVIARALELTAKVPLSILWSGAAHSRNLWEREDSLRNFFARRLSDLIDRDRVRNIEPSGLCPSQRF